MKPLALVLAILLFLVPSASSQADDLDPGYWERTPLPQVGLATFYAPGVMDYVVGYRQGRGQLPACETCVGTVALLRAGDIGRKVWLQPPGGEPVGPFLVVDCAHIEDIPPLLARGWAVDVSYEVGQLWGMDRPLAGVAVLEDPVDAGAGGAAAAAGVPTPFYVPPGQAVISQPTPTPAAAAARPTPWRPQPPVSLAPQSALPTEEAAASTATAGPPPLTPIITTPTPRPRPAATPTSSTAAAAAAAAPAPSATPQDVAVGRAGGALLPPAPSATPTAPATATQRPTASATMLQTPRLPSAPILAPATPAPPEADMPLLWRLWRSLFGGG